MRDGPAPDRIRGFVVDDLLQGQEVANDENLLLSGMLDSLAVMSLVAFIEKDFAISIPFGDVVIENFQSIDAIVAYVDGRVSENGG